ERPGNVDVVRVEVVGDPRPDSAEAGSSVLRGEVRAVDGELRVDRGEGEQAPEDDQVRRAHAADGDTDRMCSARDLELVAERGRPPRLCGASAHVQPEVEAVV